MLLFKAFPMSGMLLLFLEAGKSPVGPAVGVCGGTFGSLGADEAGELRERDTFQTCGALGFCCAELPFPFAAGISYS